MRRALTLGAIAAGTLLWLSFSWGPPAAEADPRDDDASADAGETNPMGANAACYVCHIPFVREEMSKVHLQAKIACIRCHGLSAGHANDEDIGATKPDVTFKRDEINASCRKCHEEHDVPPEEVVARWFEHQRLESPAVCTDCHGNHKIERPEEN